jgi:membrane protein implicated in regulation of membrane protease activity
MINAAQMLVLVLAFFLAGFAGLHLLKYFGWWAMIPAIFLGLLLLVVSSASLVRQFFGRHHKSENENGERNH